MYFSVSKIPERSKWMCTEFCRIRVQLSLEACVCIIFINKWKRTNLTTYYMLDVIMYLPKLNKINLFIQEKTHTARFFFSIAVFSERYRFNRKKNTVLAFVCALPASRDFVARMICHNTVWPAGLVTVPCVSYYFLYLA